MRDLTTEERRAVASLKRLAKRWPETLWLFSASGALTVMQRTADGERARKGEGYDDKYAVDTIAIPNDGGDW